MLGDKIEIKKQGDLGEALKNLRDSSNFKNQRDLALKANVSQSMICRLETGKNVQMESLQQVVKTLGFKIVLERTEEGEVVQ